MKKGNNKFKGLLDLNGEIKIIGGMGFIGKKMISQENLNGAKNGDIVKLEKIGNNPHIEEYRVIEIIASDKSSDIINKVSQKASEILEGVYKEGTEKFGFIKAPGQEQEIYVSKNNSRGAKNGDKVSYILLNLGHKTEAVVQEIVEKSKVFYYAIFKEGKVFFEGEKEIKVSNLSDFNLEEGDMISLELTEGKTGIINKKLHPKWNKSLDELKIVLKAGVEIEFSDEVLAEVDSMSETIEESEIARRVDLRDLYTITIDGPDTKDIDDAISVEDLGNGEYKLYVHIADVTHYVKADSLTGEEALKRGTSIYFLDKVIPMIPEKLSNGLCSLNPNEDKLSMTCEMIIDKNGKIDFSLSKVYESLIRSNARTTYKEIQDIFEDKKGIGNKLQFSENVDEDLVSLVKRAFALSRNLNNLRKKEGELIFDNKEIKIELDSERNPLKFKKYEMYESNDLIKALMVAANETVSVLYGNGPFLHRTHGKPKDEKIKLLQDVFSYLAVDIEGLDINAGNIDKLLKKIKGHEKEKALSTLILRTLQLAKYTHTLEGHHGLALTNYSHFTSPIRRYPDLQIHRIIKETIKGDLDKEKMNTILEKVALNCSINEQRAEKIERNINMFMAIKHLENKIGQTFDSTIMMINERGAQIELDFGSINGVLKIDKEAGYSYNNIEKGLSEILTPNEEIIKIGDKIKVKLSSLDKEDLVIYFELI